MSSISSPPPSVSTTWDPALTPTATARSADAAVPGAASAPMPDASPSASEILTRLGLAGLRLPSGTADISVLLAQTLLGTEDARGDAEKQRVALQGSTTLGLSGLYDTESLRKGLKTQQDLRDTLGTQLTAATALRDGLKSQSTAKGAEISAKDGEVASARQSLADAKTPEERASAQSTLTAREGELSRLQGEKTDIDRQLATAETTVTRITGEIRVVDAEIARIGDRIDIAAKLAQVVSAAFATTMAAREQTADLSSTKLDRFAEELFTQIAEMADRAARAANPLLREEAIEREEAPEAAPPPPPPRPVAVAAALQAAFSDLLRELDRFDPLLLARPPEQTGLDRLRLRV